LIDHFNLNTKVFCDCALWYPESVMSEVEYECLLDAVRTAIAPAPEEDFLTYPSTFNPLPKAANDNQRAWGFLLILGRFFSHIQ
jgi:hypothetical protein